MLFDRIGDICPGKSTVNAACIKKSQTRNERQYVKRSIPPSSYEEGDFVVMKNVDTTMIAEYG